MNDVVADVAANVAQQERSNNKYYASAFSNIQTSRGPTQCMEI